MMTRNFLLQGKRLILSMLILGFGSTMLYSQADSVINKYAKVIARNNNFQITVDNATDFAPGDYILIIQMKGVSISIDVNNYGALSDIVGKPGEYEFLIIAGKAGNTLTFSNKIKKYDPAGFVQIVKVPFLNTVKFNSKLTCQAWDPVSGTGGVLAMIVGRTLTMHGNIDVSGKGFTGGAADIGLGVCAYSSGITTTHSFPASFMDAGYKGEGIASHYSAFLGAIPALLASPLKGQGVLFSGGGGGNGRFSGGSGGSNRGKGNVGGLEDNACDNFPTDIQSPGGKEGFVPDSRIDTISNTGGVFMGGGGGSSTHLAGALATAGGKGGGIVIILADTIKGNNHSIIAAGDSATTATGIFSGAGGGGAGGSILIFSRSYSSTNLAIKADGSKGGDVFNLFSTNEGGGTGGGGGGGYIGLLNPKSANVSTEANGGTFSSIRYAGLPSQAQANEGTIGLTRTGVTPVLTGFLFNSISSSVTGDQTDSVCYGIIPPRINGTTPLGGTPPYTYIWESSNDQITWTPITNDPDPTNYIPKAAGTATIFYRRTIKDSSIPVITDISRPVEIIVQPLITGNLIGKDTTICFNQNPLSLIPLNSGPSNGSSHNYYLYKWIQNSLDNNWNTAPAATGNSTLPSYDPPALTNPTFYKRVVTSGRCIDYSSTVKITVLPVIQNNSILSVDQNICFGTTFTDLTATISPTLKGGDEVFRYKWESNINGSGWTTAPGANTGPGYNPTELPQKIPFNDYIFRRVVTSGLHDVCSTTSNTVDLKDYSKIINNTVASAQAVCYNLSPALLTGSKAPVLSGADGIYTYSWQQSINFTNWADTTGQTAADLQPDKLHKTTWYRRIVKSPVTGCADSSAAVKIDVHPTIVNNTVSLSTGGTAQTICNNQVPVSLIGQPPSGGFGGYVYQWMFSTDNNTFTPVPIGTALPNYSPAALTASTWFRRNVQSGACSSVSNTIPITVLPLITNNTISGTSRVCYSRLPDPVTGSSLSGGSGSYTYVWQESTDGSIWNPATGTNNTATYQPPALFNPVKYRRTATSGPSDCCSSISNVFDIAIDPLPASPINAGPDTVIFSFENIYHMKAVPLTVPGEIGTWSHLDEVKSNILDPNSYNSKIEKLERGKNVFLWTVSKGNCDLKDSVSIELLKNFIPKAFSPNGDDWNNTFVIEGLDPDDNYLDLSIVNGAGTEVFSTTNRNGHTFINWDGKNSKGLDLSEGTYYYMLKITPKTGTGTAPPQSGFIILKRY